MGFPDLVALTLMAEKPADATTCREIRRKQQKERLAQQIEWEVREHGDPRARTSAAVQVTLLTTWKYGNPTLRQH